MEAAPRITISELHHVGHSAAAINNMASYAKSIVPYMISYNMTGQKHSDRKLSPCSLAGLKRPIEVTPDTPVLLLAKERCLNHH